MVLSVAGFSSCREPGRLAAFAAGAKQRGEKTAEIFDKVPRVTSNNLESALKASSVVLATASPKQVVVTTQEMVYTWQFVKIEQWLSQVPLRPHDCGQIPRPPLAIPSADEAMVPIGAGTTTIDGVMISVTTEESQKFTPGQLYLLLVGECRNQEVRLIYGEQSVYLVDNTGAISAPRSETFDPFAKELLAVKTVDAIKERIRNSSR
jgi:hypothetical protein